MILWRPHQDPDTISTPDGSGVHDVSPPYLGRAAHRCAAFFHSGLSQIKNRRRMLGVPVSGFGQPNLQSRWDRRLAGHPAPHLGLAYIQATRKLALRPADGPQRDGKLSTSH
jgi:hypothetical protein